MQVTVKLVGGFVYTVGFSQKELDVEPGTTVSVGAPLALITAGAAAAPAETPTMTPEPHEEPHEVPAPEHHAHEAHHAAVSPIVRHLAHDLHAQVWCPRYERRQLPGFRAPAVHHGAPHPAMLLPSVVHDPRARTGL